MDQAIEEEFLRLREVRRRERVRLYSYISLLVKTSVGVDAHGRKPDNLELRFRI